MHLQSCHVIKLLVSNCSGVKLDLEDHLSTGNTRAFVCTQQCSSREPVDHPLSGVSVLEYLPRYLPN